MVCGVLPVASVLASMRWLLCGGDGSKKKKKNDVCNFEKNVPRENLSPFRFLLIQKKKNALNYEYYGFN